MVGHQNSALHLQGFLYLSLCGYATRLGIERLWFKSLLDREALWVTLGQSLSLGLAQLTGLLGGKVTHEHCSKVLGERVRYYALIHIHFQYMLTVPGMCCKGSSVIYV